MIKCALLLVLLAPFCAQASRLPCWIFLKDKAGSVYDPYTWLDEKAIARRQREGFDLHHRGDYPVSESYLAQVRALSDTVLFASRWLNALAAYVQPEQLEALKKLPFVLEVEVRTGGGMHTLADEAQAARELDADDLELLKYQTGRMQGDLFQQKGVTGKGVRIAVLDAGFTNAHIAPELAHLWRNNQIIRTYDFVRDKEQLTYKDGVHGAMVLSCIAGQHGEHRMGLAPDA